MQQQNWKAIESSLVVPLDDSDRALLDRVQAQLALNDREFVNVVSFVANISRYAAPSAAWIAAQLPPYKQFPPEPLSNRVRDLVASYYRELQMLKTKEREFQARAERGGSAH